MRGIALILSFCALFSSPVFSKDTKLVFGRVEKATLVEHHVTLSAKLDTGAKSASLNATHIQTIKQKGKLYLRFQVPNASPKLWFHGEYVGDIQIKSRADEKHHLPQKGAPIIRPVILMPIQLGQQIKTIRVNLTNRKRFIYPLLLGREAIIAFNGTVDPNLKFTLSHP